MCIYIYVYVRIYMYVVYIYIANLVNKQEALKRINSDNDLITITRLIK